MVRFVIINCSSIILRTTDIRKRLEEHQHTISFFLSVREVVTFTISLWYLPKSRLEGHVMNDFRVTAGALLEAPRLCHICLG